MKKKQKKQTPVLLFSPFLSRLPFIQHSFQFSAATLVKDTSSVLFWRRVWIGEITPGVVGCVTTVLTAAFQPQRSSVRNQTEIKEGKVGGGRNRERMWPLTLRHFLSGISKTTKRTPPVLKRTAVFYIHRRSCQLEMNKKWTVRTMWGQLLFWAVVCAVLISGVSGNSTGCWP